MSMKSNPVTSCRFVELSVSTGEKKTEGERKRKEEKALYLLNWHAARFSWRSDGCPLGAGSPPSERRDDVEVLCCDGDVLVASIDFNRRVRSLCFVRVLEPSEADMQLHMLQWTVGKDAHGEITLSMRLCYSL